MTQQREPLRRSETDEDRMNLPEGKKSVRWLKSWSRH
jgi:hypothetical protein